MSSVQYFGTAQIFQMHGRLFLLTNNTWCCCNLSSNCADFNCVVHLCKPVSGFALFGFQFVCNMPLFITRVISVLQRSQISTIMAAIDPGVKSKAKHEKILKWKNDEYCSKMIKVHGYCSYFKDYIPAEIQENQIRQFEFIKNHRVIQFVFR